MRGLRGLAGALALVVWAGEARSQYYPYNPYPQPNGYGYGYSPYSAGYTGNPYPYYNGPAPGAVYAPAPTTSRSQYYPGAAGQFSGSQGLGTPPIFTQSSVPAPQSRYMPPVNAFPAQPQAVLAPLPAAAPNLPPPASVRPLVVQSQPVNPPAFPRSLPNDSKADSAVPNGERTSPPAKDDSGTDDDGVPATKKSATANDDREAAAPEDKPRDPAPLGPPPALGPAAHDPHAGPSSFMSFFTTDLGQVRQPCIWASAEYLVWWERNGPLSAPLVTGNPNTGAGGAIGALNEPGTQILLGSGPGSQQPNVNFNAFSGGRFTFGGWVDPSSIFGLEGGGLVLERRASLFTASSAGGAAPIVSIPFNATEPFIGNPAGETSLNAGGAPNTVTATSYSHLWGMEANAIFNFSNSSNFRLVGLVGFRYLNLTESLFLADTFLDSTTNGAVVVQDAFGTQNHFFGGQVGIRGGTNFNRITLDGSAKVAFGDNSQSLNIGGQTVVSNGAFGLANSQTGVFAEPSNIGHYHRDEFSIVPEFNLQLGYLLTPYVRPFMSYNFLLFSRVLRPGDEINRNINPTENPTFGGTGGIVSGFPSPLPIFRTQDFWAQGLTFGVEVRY